MVNTKWSDFLPPLPTGEGSGERLCLYRRCCFLQSISRSSHLDSSGLATILHYHQALSVESLAVVVLELLHRDGASVVHSGNEAGTFYGKGHIVFGIRTQISVFIQNLDSNETQVFAICLDGVWAIMYRKYSLFKALYLVLMVSRL